MIFILYSQYECCGLTGPQDYLDNKIVKLPSSCCHYGDCSNSNNVFPKGCEVMSIKFIDNQSDNLIISLVGLVGIEVSPIEIP